MPSLLDSTTPTQLTPLSLAAVASSSSLPTSGVFRGRVTSVRPYSPHTKLAHFTLVSTDASDKAQLEVELKGWWAERAARRFRVGETVVLRTAGGKIVEGSAKGKEKAGEGGKRRLRFDKGVSGWVVREGGKEEVLRYSATDPRQASSAATTVLPLPRPATKPRPAAAKPPAPAAPLRHSTNNPPLPPKQPPKPAQAAPAKRPAPPPTDPSIAPAVKQSTTTPKNSVPGEGARTVKRRKQEEKLGWGCTAADDTVYTPFTSMGDVLAATTTKKLANVFALVTEVGDVFEPRQPDGDWYRKLRLTCPSCPSVDVELQWYAKAEAALPEPEYGQIIVARGLLVKGSPSSFTLLSGSYSPAPHALLSLSHLLASPPTQHPSPDPPAGVPPEGGKYACRDALLRRRTGIELDEQEVKHAVRVARFFKRERGLGGEVVLAGREEKAADEGEGDVSMEDISVLVAKTKTERRVSGGLGGGRPLLRVEELEEGKFCDLIGMITKFYNPTSFALSSLPSNHSIQLYVTDYTLHPLLFDVSPATVAGTAAGVTGRRVLRVSLFGYQAEPLLPLLKQTAEGETEIKRGALVHLRNLRVKTNDEGLLEATMVEEREERYRWKRDVTVLTSTKGVDERWREAMKGLQRRHREYWGTAAK
ncbi:hypothetical protein JCM8097_005231 [Rhodosporidiobolus ruineniae]